MEAKNKNKWAIILGSSSGMGKATARKLAEAGMNLILVHRDRRNRMEEIASEEDFLKAKGVKIISFNKNALIPETMEEVTDALVHENAKVRLLLHSVSKGNLKSMLSDGAFPGKKVLSIQDYQLTMESMATSLYSWAQAILDKNLFSDKARIIGLSSEGNKRVWKAYAAVGAAKAVLESIIKYMAVEFAPLGIRANIIQAGITDTPSLRLIPGAEDLLDYSQKRNPLGRATLPEDVANAVYLLSLPEADWINGAVITVDGGERPRLVLVLSN